MKIIGTIERIGGIKQITPKFSKAELILQTNDKYPQTLCIEWANKNADLIANFKSGDMVEVSINIQGREWTSPTGDVKYFTSLSGWAIVHMGGTPSQEGIPKQVLDDELSNTWGGDLPF